MATLKIPDLSIQIFGGVINSDSSAHYPGLELFNYLTHNEAGILPDSEETKLIRYGHDFARRLVRDNSLTQTQKDEVLADKFSEESVIRLLHCLELKLENIAKPPSWERTHFYPYSKSLSHWDARFRGKNEKASFDRRYYRGSGAYAFNILRFDTDKERLFEIRDGLSKLFEKTNDSPLENIARTLLYKGGFDLTPIEDEIEKRSREMKPDDGLDNIYRNGIKNILSHNTLASFSKIKAIVNWTSIWLVIMGNIRGSSPNDKSKKGFIIDCSATNQQLRRESQKSLKLFLNRLDEGLNYHIKGRDVIKNQLRQLKGFFTITMASMGLINSLKGRRHFIFGLDCIETLTLATIYKNQEISFDNFVHSFLFEKYNFIVGRQAAHEQELLDFLDASIFEENERHLADQLKAVGMLRVYSDATRMVGVGSER